MGDSTLQPLPSTDPSFIKICNDVDHRNTIQTNDFLKINISIFVPINILSR